MSGPTGPDTAKTTNFRISGIRARCGDRVDTLNSRKYSKRSRSDHTLKLYDGSGGRPNPMTEHPNDVLITRIDARNNEYTAKVELSTCMSDHCLCYIAFYSSRGKKIIFECGKPVDLFKRSTVTYLPTMAEDFTISRAMHGPYETGPTSLGIKDCVVSAIVPVTILVFTRWISRNMEHNLPQIYERALVNTITPS